MGESSVDRSLAAAESRLDRLDDEVSGTTNGHVGSGVDLDLDGMHVEHAGEPGDDLDDDLDHGNHTELADAIDAFNEAFNARDLDALVDLVSEDCECPGLGNDRTNLPDTIEALWEQRPGCMLTRGELEEQHLSILWELAEGEGWWRSATLWFDDVSDGQVGVVELSDDPDVLERAVVEPPDGEVEEGSRWSEWDQGVDGD